jgi:hypothetical protein
MAKMILKIPLSLSAVYFALYVLLFGNLLSTFIPCDFVTESFVSLFKIPSKNDRATITLLSYALLRDG